MKHRLFQGYSARLALGGGEVSEENAKEQMEAAAKAAREAAKKPTNSESHRVIPSRCGLLAGWKTF